MAKRTSYNQLCWNEQEKKYEICKETAFTDTPTNPCPGGCGGGPTSPCCLPALCCLKCDAIMGLAQCLGKFNDPYRPGANYTKTALMPIYNIYPGYPGVGQVGATATPDINQLKTMLEFDDLFTDPCGYSINASDPVIVTYPGNEPKASCYSSAGGLDSDTVTSIFDVFTVCLAFTSADPNCPDFGICWEWYFEDAGSLVNQPIGSTFLLRVRNVKICTNPSSVRGSDINNCTRCSGTNVIGCDAQISGNTIITATKQQGTTNQFTYKFTIPQCCNATTMEISEPQTLSPYGGKLDYDPIPGSYPVTVPLSGNVPLTYTIPPGHPSGVGREFEANFTITPDNPACGTLSVTLVVTVTP